jgi:hypothetical protein
MNSYVVDVKRPIELLQMLIQELGGDLSRLDIQCLEGEVKLRAWMQCGDSRAVNIVLSEMNKTALIKSLLPRLGVRKRVYGITLKKAGQMLFHAYDNFCPWPEQPAFLSEGSTDKLSSEQGVA